MSSDEQDWKRLAEYVLARRTELGYRRQKDLAHAMGVSLRVASNIETGRPGHYSRNTLASLARALQWRYPDSIEAILAGGEPTPETVAPAVNFQIVSEAIMTDGQVTQDERDELVRKLLRDPAEAWEAYQRLRAHRSAERERGWPWEQSGASGA